MDTTEDSPMPPAIVTVLAGGSAVAYMLWANGLQMFSHWFFYPSFLILGCTTLSLFVGLEAKSSRIIWTFCKRWSGLWVLAFMLAVVLALPSLAIIDWLVRPILAAGNVHPFLAGALHILIWACAKDILKMTHPNTVLCAAKDSTEIT